MRKRLFAGAVAALFLFICYPLLVPLAMAAIFAALFAPLQSRLEARKVNPKLAAAGITVGFTGLLLMPMASMFVYVSKLGVQQFQAWKAQLPNAAAAATAASGSVSKAASWDSWFAQ